MGESEIKIKILKIQTPCWFKISALLYSAFVISVTCVIYFYYETISPLTLVFAIFGSFFIIFSTLKRFTYEVNGKMGYILEPSEVSTNTLREAILEKERNEQLRKLRVAAKEGMTI
jgi:hypothetical protein